VRRFFRTVLFIITLEPALHAQPDPSTLIRESIERYRNNWHAAMQWGYTQIDKGEKETTTSKIFPLEGTPYEIVVAKDGKPLPPDLKAKEDRKFQKELTSRRAESPDDRKARIRKYEMQQDFLKELPAAYDFRPIGEETIAGRPAWIVTLTPKPGFEPQLPHSEMLKHIEGKLWIDKEDLQWARAEAHVIGTISIGLILARIGPGAHIRIDLARVAPGLWLPSKMNINGTARLLLLHDRKLNEQLLFTDYHRAPPTPSSKQIAQMMLR